MNLSNARQAVHDAFALQMTTPERVSGAAGTKFNALNAIARGLEAGQVMRAALDDNDIPGIRATAVFLNAPDGVATDNEIAEMKSHLWEEFISKNGIDYKMEGKIVAIIDLLILGYKNRAWNHKSTQLSIGEAINLVSNSKDESKEIIKWANRLLDVFSEMDSKSLEGVWQLLDEQKEFRDEEINASAA